LQVKSFDFISESKVWFFVIKVLFLFKTRLKWKGRTKSHVKVKISNNSFGVRRPRKIKRRPVLKRKIAIKKKK